VNFVGVDVRGLDLESFFRAGRLAYVAAYLAWVVWLWRGRRRAGVWGPVLLSVFCWALTTFPLQRIYGLMAPSDRLRHLWWSAVVAAGLPPWESGVLDRRSLEPLWGAAIGWLSLGDPARVWRIFPWLPAAALVLTGAGLAWAFRARPLRALLVAFFLLLACTQPLDYGEPFRAFWARQFMLKPNHAIGMALVAPAVSLLSGPLTRRRMAAAAAVLGALGWAFVVDWVLLCAGVVCGMGLLGLRRRLAASDARRMAGGLLAGGAVVAPFVWYLAREFPSAVSFSAGTDALRPLRSPWGDAPPSGDSLFFLATFDLGPHFALTLVGAWSGWRSRRRADLLWLGVLLAAYGAWACTALLYALGRARAADEVYWFVVFSAAVHAGLGADALLRRAAAALRARGRRPRLALRRLAACALVVWAPFTLGWWWHPPRMDAHFNVSLEPVPPDLVALGAWLRDHAHPRDVVLAGEPVAQWVPAVSGRRVLRVGAPAPGSADHARESALLRPGPLSDEGRALAARDLRFVVWDASLAEEHGQQPSGPAPGAPLAPRFRAGDLTVYGLEPD
jgi:hypothetical protein